MNRGLILYQSAFERPKTSPDSHGLTGYCVSMAPAEGPATVGVRERAEVGSGLFTLHVARDGHRGRHFVLFRVGPSGRRQRHIEVLRLLHDAMDLKSHVRDT